MAVALMIAMSTAEMEERTIANLIGLKGLKTSEIVVFGTLKFNNKLALEPMR